MKDHGNEVAHRRPWWGLGLGSNLRFKILTWVDFEKVTKVHFQHSLYSFSWVLSLTFRSVVILWRRLRRTNPWYLKTKKCDHSGKPPRNSLNVVVNWKFWTVREHIETLTEVSMSLITCNPGHNCTHSVRVDSRSLALVRVAWRQVNAWSFW